MTSDEHNAIQEIRSDIKAIYIMLRGDDRGQLGLIQQVRFIWKTFWLWPLCSLSAIGGAIMTITIQRLFH